MIRGLAIASMACVSTIAESFPSYVRGMVRRAWIDLRDGKDR